jgi:excisionase family DNA binding protein
MGRMPMTTGEVARRLCRSEDTVRKYADEGVLEARRTQAGLRLFDADAVDALAQRLEREQAGR